MTDSEPVSSTLADGAPTSAAFRGFASPHYTQVPDDLFDELLSLLSGAELKVLLYIIRRTFGFKKTSEAISLQQIRHGITTRDGRVLDRGTGLSLSATQSAIKGLITKGVLLTVRNRSHERGDEATTYRLHLCEHTEDQAMPHHTTSNAAGGDEAHRERVSQTLESIVPRPATDSRQGALPKIGSGGYRKAVSQETGFQQTAVKLRNSKATRPQENQEENGEPKAGERTSAASVPEAPSTLSHDARATAHPARWSQARPRGTSSPQDLRALLATRPLPTVPSAGLPIPLPQPARDDGAGITAPSQPTPLPARPASTHHGRIRPTPAIAVAVTEVSQEFGDLGHLAANSTQAMHLWQQSGRGEPSFVSILYEARSITKQQPGVVSRISYYWTVVRDLLGLLAEGDAPPPPQHAA